MDFREMKEKEGESEVSIQNLEDEIRRIKERMNKMKFDLKEKDEEVDLLTQENNELQEELILNTEEMLVGSQLMQSGEKGVKKELELELGQKERLCLKLKEMNNRLKQKIGTDKERNEILIRSLQ